MSDALSSQPRACSHEVETFEELTVAVPYEAVIDLIDLLGFVARLCAHQPSAIDAAIDAAAIGRGAFSAPALAARSATMAWALARSAWPGEGWEPAR